MLPELSALQTLEIEGRYAGCSLQLERLELWLWSFIPCLIIKGWNEYSNEAVTRLIDVIKHKIPDSLELSEMNLKLSVAESLSRLLPELSALQTLKINGLTERSDGAGSRFFAAFKLKTLETLELNEINVTSAATETFAQSLHELSALQTLKISGLTECSDEAVTKLVAAIKHKTLKELELSEINFTPVAAEVLGQSLPELSALKTLKISGLDECSEEAVTKLVAAIKHKTLKELELSEINFTSVAAEVLGQSLPELSALKTLKISGLDECSEEAVAKLVAAIKHKTLKELQLKLNGIKLTLEAAKALRQPLLAVSDLIFELNGFAECSAKETYRLLEVAIPSRISLSAVFPHAGCSKFKVNAILS